jgi:hypothetical protein
MTFKRFFESYQDISKLKLASNPRHRTGGAITNPSRKHQNIVADSQRKSNEYGSYSITKAKYNGGSTKLSEIQADTLAKKYGLNLINKDKTKPFSLALKQRDGNGIGRYLEYDPKLGYSIQIKKI